VRDRSGEAATLNNMGRVFRLQGNLVQALQYYQQALGLLQDVGDLVNTATILANIAMIQIETDRLEDAEQTLQQVVELDTRFGLPTLEEDRLALQWVQNR